MTVVQKQLEQRQLAGLGLAPAELAALQAELYGGGVTTEQESSRRGGVYDGAYVGYYDRVRGQNQATKKKEKELTAFGEFVEVYAELICAAQEFLRNLHGGERSVVSLRDVARCVTVFRWFGDFLSRNAEGAWPLRETNYRLRDHFLLLCCSILPRRLYNTSCSVQKTAILHHLA